jgi:hypothetical protein
VIDDFRSRFSVVLMRSAMLKDQTRMAMQGAQQCMITKYEMAGAVGGAAATNGGRCVGAW